MEEVKFSDKYENLFNLLTEDVEALKKVDTVLMSGGRDSGKSFSLGCFVGLGAAQFNHRVLFTRQTMSSTDNSITAALDNRLKLLGIDSFFQFANNNYTVRDSVGKISITGQKTSVGTQTAKLKSLENYSIFITDEAEELTSYDEWIKIKRSMRATDVQCLSILCFNPPTKKHWIYSEFYQGVPEGFNGIIDNVLYIHTTYLDNGQENMAPHNWLEYERLRLVYEKYIETPQDERPFLPKKMIREYKEYKHTVLGGFRDSAEGVIFDYTVGEFYESEYGAVYGLDQGFTHPTALVKVFVDKNEKKIYLKEIFYKTNQTASQIYNVIKDEVGFTRIWCDSAAAMFIKDLYNKGLNIKACKKPKIKDRINLALDYEIIIDKNSLNLQNEMNNYRWSDKNQDQPFDDNNHAIDAWGYAFTHIINENIAQIL